MTDDETRNPADVLRVAAQDVNQEWAVWHPGDGTQYRVKLVPQLGGPNHGDLALMVSVTDVLVAVPFIRPIPAYRFKPWNAARWKRSGLNPPGGYDWWPLVMRPLLAVAEPA